MSNSESLKRRRIEEDESSSDDEPVIKTAAYRAKMRRLNKGKEEKIVCPYLDTINRSILDFDFEKVCSVSLLNQNIYCCLVCGKYFQGRGKHTHAYTHCLQEGHHVFINLHNRKVYCLPANYLVDDSSLDDIKYQLNPTFVDAQIKLLDSSSRRIRGLDGKEFIPGFVGLNNSKDGSTDFINVVIHQLCHVSSIRDFFLKESNYTQYSGSRLVCAFGELLRKIWNPKNFRGHVSPHEFLQAVILQSDGVFNIGQQGDPCKFASWLLNTLHEHLGGQKGQRGTVIDEAFGLTLRVTSILGNNPEAKPIIEYKRVMWLDLEIPPPPLFKDAVKDDVLPQVPLPTILEKYNGEKETYDSAENIFRTMIITELPRYLLLKLKRLSKNEFFIEKNPTIVNFTVKNLDMSPYTDEGHKATRTRFDLSSTVTHHGLPQPGLGKYTVHLRNPVDEQWYEAEDLFVEERLSQVVALSEATLQVYERTA
eukprot:GCRY01002497.1.p1 GENE.GCRY01002497.1~~GCRY01002497.1.p1  ORF type:complete len:495 (-),score=82.29 GCRY01002497.1:50-1486(-)